jgi:preprotein translocase subunit SecF
MDWMKYRWLYLLISGTVLICGGLSMIKWGFKFGVDFVGGAILEYRFDKDVSEDQAISIVETGGAKVLSIQETGNSTYIFKLSPIDSAKKDQIKESLEKETASKVEELRFESVGPSIGPELVKKTVIALAISASLILLWIAYQFKSLKFGISATLATIHDSLVLLGSFSLLGHFFGAEVDFLFVTAMLTILSFSVHDTIVVYDRIRETQKRGGGSIYEMANNALSETMVRSLNNSFTIIFMLVALILLGGTTMRFFAVALLIGTISGTYSSPFVAVPILITWDELQKKFKKK